MRFTQPPWLPVHATTGYRACALTITPTTTVRLYSIPTATMSKPFATGRNEYNAMSATPAQRFLNVGGNNRNIPVPEHFAGWEHHLLDIDPVGQPDVLCDARQLNSLPPATYDAVYCSHNLEHYHDHEVPRVLAGFIHILKPGGFAHIRVFMTMQEQNIDFDATLYDSPAGPMTPLDVIYGWRRKIASSGVDFYAHKTGFSQPSLVRTLHRAGFRHVFSGRGFYEVSAYAFVDEPSASQRTLLGVG
jgi:predicted SAM-dependent methyltransferase